MVCGGARLSDGELAHGYFMQPTIIANVTPNMRIAREEVFGPVIAIIAVENFDEAIAVANGVDVGLSASIVTRDIKKAMLYSERIQAGVVKINQISTGLALQAPFGGVKKSQHRLLQGTRRGRDRFLHAHQDGLFGLLGVKGQRGLRESQNRLPSSKSRVHNPRT